MLCRIIWQHIQMKSLFYVSNVTYMLLNVCLTCQCVLLYFDSDYYILYLYFAWNYTMGDPTPPAIHINKPSFNCESQNLHEAFKIFKYQAKYLLIDGQYKSYQDQDKVGALLN